MYERENKKLKDQKEKIIRETKEKADSFLNDMNKQFEGTIKNIKEANAKKESIIEEKLKIQNLKQKVKEIYHEPKEEILIKQSFKVNDFVQIKDSFTTGEIVDLDDEKGTVTIDTGSIRIRAKIKNLIHSNKPKTKPTLNQSFVSTSIESTRLDIRGQKPEEIEFEVIKFIDDAHLSGLKHVEIIHGKGTGVLRENVHQLLKNHELVKSFDLASVEFGGAGATNVSLK